MYTYNFPRPALTADVVAIRDRDGAREVLLILRGHNPYKGLWALPGGFIDEYEVPADAARRELAEETGVVWDGELTLVGVFSKRGRDPRGWTVATAFLARVGDEELALAAADDAVDARWFPVTVLPEVAFDHHEVVEAAVAML